MKHTIIACVFGISCTAGLQAQNNEWRARTGVSLKVPITKKLDAKISHQRSFEATDHFKSRMNSVGIRATYELDKRADVVAGAVWLQNPRRNSSISKVFAGIRYESRLGDWLAWKNGIQAETFSRPTGKFKHRVIISSKIGLRKRMDFLNLSPSVGYALYYNIGGKDLQYYDGNKRPAVKQSPDGFHRGRFNVTLSSRVNKHLSLSLYYFNQHEFNFIAGEYRRIHVERPNGKITRRFNNYNAAGITMNITIGRNGTKPVF